MNLIYRPLPAVWPSGERTPAWKRLRGSQPPSPPYPSGAPDEQIGREVMVAAGQAVA